MKQTIGYIYIRVREHYDNQFNVCKLGKTNNIPERDSQYATGEVFRGRFELVIEMRIENTKKVEQSLQNEFRHLQFLRDGGIEFYDKKIIDLVEPHIRTLNIYYRKLSKLEIDNLVRCNRQKTPTQTPQTPLGQQDYSHEPIVCESSVVHNKPNILLKSLPKIREYQNIIVEKSIAHFQQHDKGLLVLICGAGKTLISLWVAQKLQSNRILIGVPNLLLLKQWEDVIHALFQNVPCLIVSCGVRIETITEFLDKNKTKCIVLTTYSSAHKVHNAAQQFKFDMKILDEAHHLTTKNMKSSRVAKTYVQMLHISANKQLALTATLKQLDSAGAEDDCVVANDNIEYFGEIIEKKNLLWAINEKIVCDYIIQTIITDEEKVEQHFKKFNIEEEHDKRLFLSAYAALKSIFTEHSHHLLIYTNNKINSSKLIACIGALLSYKYFAIPELYYSNYHGDMAAKLQKKILHNFEKAKMGIITCVYCLGEGWDFPILDGVIFAENMTSNIRIVQSALRASRKNKDEPAKQTKIILPVLNKDDWLDDTENTDLKKVREIIYQMGLEDASINQKITVFKMDIKNVVTNERTGDCKNVIDEFGEYDNELTRKLRLKTTTRVELGITYEKARNILVYKNIKSKEKYYELCETDTRLPKNPEITFKKQFRNWIEYLSIKRVYYDLETCKKKVKEYLLLYPEFKKHYLNISVICEELVKLDVLFPPNDLWEEYYGVKMLCEIIDISSMKKKRLVDIF